ncbi:MAG: hypothetical protein K9G83_08500 [Hyphomonadaceae bacterium]|nr:hypothetical protein [Hyphomonadaceae bacterium]
MNKLVSVLALATALGACQTMPMDGSSTMSSADSSTAMAWKAKRGPDGVHPDLNGVWKVMNTANYNIEAHPASAALQLRPGPYVPVPDASVVALGAIGAVPAGVGIVQGDGKIPYTADALAVRDANRAKAVEMDPEVKCYLPGIPRANYMDKPFQIFHSDKAVFIAYEFAGAVRNIFIEEPDPAPAQSWMGQSYGRWDGDTFVVEVTDQLPTTWLDRSGNIKGEDTKIVERWTPTSDFTMRYEAEISDPSVYTKPWKIGFNLYKATGEDAQLQQFKCVEFVEELMYGHLRKNPLPGPALERAKREAEERAAEEAELGE